MTKYVVTDPCYLTDDQELWRAYCDLLFTDIDKDNAKSTNYLAKKTGFKILGIADTGVGDWSNSIKVVKGDSTCIKERSFGADAGLVCLVEVDDNFKKWNAKNDHYGAEFELDTLTNFDFDTSKDFTVLRVKGNYNNQICEISSCE